MSAKTRFVSYSLQPAYSRRLPQNSRCALTQGCALRPLGHMLPSSLPGCSSLRKPRFRLLRAYHHPFVALERSPKGAFFAEPKFHCRRQFGMNFGFVAVSEVNSNRKRSVSRELHVTNLCLILLAIFPNKAAIALRISRCTDTSSKADDLHIKENPVILRQLLH